MLSDALARTRSHQFLGCELHCATSLAALKQRQGMVPAARDLLTPVYQRFDEGLDSSDVKAPRTLLSSLG
jgi:hypothetical protein